MACLETIRDNFIDMDMALELMEDAFAAFAEFQIAVAKEDVEAVDTLRYNFTNMLNLAKSVQEEIVRIQAPFQKELIAGVEQFRQDVLDFDRDYELYGPMVPGLSASEASDRVLLYQGRFDDLWDKMITYNSGEKLFGMEVQEYPILHQKKKEFNLLNKLYGLYITVNQTIDGYFDLLWTDVDIDVIIEQITDFQNRFLHHFSHFPSSFLFSSFCSNTNPFFQVPKASKGDERLASLLGFEEKDRRLQ